jgi:hypothetical protein
VKFGVESQKEVNPGKEPGSEYETRAIMELISTIQPHMILNIHSGSYDVLIPYDSTSDERPPFYSKMVQIANIARAKSCPMCKVGSSELLLYHADGTLVDYALVHEKVPLGYTLEIFQNQGLVEGSCLDYFNPTAGSQLQLILIKWMDFLLTMIDKASDRIPGILSQSRVNK